MSDLSKKELDKLFQQGAEQYDFDYNPASWKQMETLMDKDDRRRRILWWFFGGVAVFFLVSGILFFGKNDSEKPTLSTSSGEKEQFEKQKLPTDDKEGEKAANQNFEPKQSGKQAFPEGKENVESGIQEFQSSTTLRNLPSQPKDEENILSRNKQNKKVPIADVQNVESKIDQKGDFSDLRFSLKLPAFSDSAFAEKAKITAEQNREKNALAALELLPTMAVVFDKNLGLLSVASWAESSSSDLLLLDHPARVKNAFVMGFNVATELISAGVDNFSKAGWKAGVQMEYQFAGKYSFGLGANIIRKNYVANKGEFSPPKGFWVRKIEANETKSKSTVLEIPLLVSFYTRGYSNSGFYASGGITSYFMLRENYRFSFDLPDPDLVRAWGTENQNRTWFGMGEISIGYYKRTGTKTAFKIAPYLQIPIRGVGEGKVKLYSMGLNFRFDFRLHQ